MAQESEKSIWIAQFQKLGIKHSPAQILRIAQKSDGMIIFLEIGNSLSGWQHIWENHGSDFVRRSVAEEQIPDLIMDAIIKGNPIGTQRTGRIIYQVIFEGQLQYVSITVGNNGYIVGANPTPMRLIRQFSQRRC